MANKWRNDDFNRWDEREIRRWRNHSYDDEPRQYAQDFSGPQHQYDTSSNGDEMRRARPRRERTPYQPEDQYQQNTFTPGTFFYGGAPTRHFGLGPADRGFEGNSPDEYGRYLTDGAMDRSRYNGLIDRARLDETYRDVGAFERMRNNERYDRAPWRESSSQRYSGYDNGRGMWDKTRDEVSSWFGDDDAEARRRMDERQNHSGKGPKGYTRSDDRIREDINDHLTRDWHVDASHIEATVKGCEVTLTGTVASRAQKRRAEDIAENVMGVKNVQNNLRVVDTRAGASAQTTPSMLSETEASNASLSARRSV